MRDYIDVLLDELSDSRLSVLGHEYFLQQQREYLATEALSDTLSEEQQKLFMSYEEEHNACAAMRMDSFARQAFLLAKEIYR